MTRARVVFLFTAVFLGFALASHAILPVPEYTGRVVDLAGALDPQARLSLDSKLRGLEAEKGSQLAVLIVPTLDGEDIASFSHRVAEQWKLGRKGIDDGALLVVAKNDKRMRVEVGYGLEGAIPDAIAKRVVSDVIAPRFNGGDFSGGITAGVNALSGVIRGEPLPEPAPRESSALSPLLMLVLFFLFLWLLSSLDPVPYSPRGYSSGRRGRSGYGPWIGGWMIGGMGGGGFGGGGGGRFGGGGASGGW